MEKLEASREPAPPRQATLRGHRLLAAKAAWVIMAVLVVGLSVAFMPVTHADAIRATRVMDAVFDSCRDTRVRGGAAPRDMQFA